MPEAATYDPLGAAGTWRRNSAKLIVYALLGLFALCYLLPLCVVVLNSFRDLPDINRNGLIGLPHSFSLNYWSLAWNKFCVGGTCEGIQPFFFNSVAMVVPATIISTAIGSVNGYVLSKWRFPGSEILVRPHDAWRLHAWSDGSLTLGARSGLARPNQLDCRSRADPLRPGFKLHHAVLPQLLREYS